MTVITHTNVILFFIRSVFRTVVVLFALRPKSTDMVIAGRSVHLTTIFPGQTCTSS